MRRRTLLAAAAGGLVALIGAGVGVWSQVPVIPNAPPRMQGRPSAGSRIAMGDIP